ncbi:hypothetical protein G7Y79_00019g047060 [Physcia stellaris]|nr:hypothetical protein G7Y79_00019g047060 [Physcia stellaris]
MKVDGGCRRNGYADAVGAAAVVRFHGNGSSKSYTWALPNNPSPTSQRAELAAIVHALEMARDKGDELKKNVGIKVRIDTDSRYAYKCITQWSRKWIQNGWTNSAGNKVANRDLIQEALDLEHEICDHIGTLKIKWISRSENQIADKAVNDKLNAMQGDTHMRDSSSEDESSGSDSGDRSSKTVSEASEWSSSDDQRCTVFLPSVYIVPRA